MVVRLDDLGPVDIIVQSVSCTFTRLLFLSRRHSSGSCSAGQPGVRLLASLQSYFAANNNNTIMAESNGTMDRLGQRVYFHSDFKGRDHDNVCPSMVRGIDFIRDPRLNKVKKKTLNSFES